MKKHFLLLTFCVCFLFNCKETRSQNLNLISVEEMQELVHLEDMQLVDVRTPSEYNEGHVPNAQNIDFWGENFDAKIDELDKTKPIIVYCKSGGRSAKCASKLAAKGFEKIYDLKGGFSQWKLEKKEIQK
ncbi:MAG: Thiosulfate sulfurtransferase GlpE [Formosa sp. Hel3_A1_48]|nr:MAG: Thiosulfate sulfurtransferase GlpE [Formosa sp. Hel3_A1_48]